MSTPMHRLPSTAFHPSLIADLIALTLAIAIWWLLVSPIKV